MGRTPMNKVYNQKSTPYIPTPVQICPVAYAFSFSDALPYPSPSPSSSPPSPSSSPSPSSDSAPPPRDSSDSSPSCSGAGESPVPSRSRSRSSRPSSRPRHGEDGSVGSVGSVGSGLIGGADSAAGFAADALSAAWRAALLDFLAVPDAGVDAAVAGSLRLVEREDGLLRLGRDCIGVRCTSRLLSRACRRASRIFFRSSRGPLARSQSHRSNRRAALRTADKK